MHLWVPMALKDKKRCFIYKWSKVIDIELL